MWNQLNAQPSPREKVIKRVVGWWDNNEENINNEPTIFDISAIKLIKNHPWNIEKIFLKIFLKE